MGKHFGSVFNASVLKTMEPVEIADLFRYAVLFVEGGVYVSPPLLRACAVVHSCFGQFTNVKRVGACTL